MSLISDCYFACISKETLLEFLNTHPDFNEKLTVLHIAVIHNNIEAIKLLYSFGININSNDISAFHLASFRCLCGAGLVHSRF